MKPILYVCELTFCSLTVSAEQRTISSTVIGHVFRERVVAGGREHLGGSGASAADMPEPTQPCDPDRGSHVGGYAPAPVGNFDTTSVEVPVVDGDRNSRRCCHGVIWRRSKGR